MSFDKTQSQICKDATSNPSKIFHFTTKKNKEKLARFIFVEHPSISFDEKLDFVNYYQNHLNLVAKHIPMSTLRCTIHKFY